MFRVVKGRFAISTHSFFFDYSGAPLLKFVPKIAHALIEYGISSDRVG
jgi:hypothetical protein